LRRREIAIFLGKTGLESRSSLVQKAAFLRILAVFLRRSFRQPKLMSPLVSSSSDCVPTIQSAAARFSAQVSRFPGDLAAVRQGRFLSVGGRWPFRRGFLSCTNGQPKATAIQLCKEAASDQSGRALRLIGLPLHASVATS